MQQATGHSYIEHLDIQRTFLFFQFHVTVHHTMINENTSLMQLLSI